MEKTKNGKSKKNNRLCRAGGKLGSSWLLATTLSMVFLNWCSSFSSSVLIIIDKFRCIVLVKEWNHVLLCHFMKEFVTVSDLSEVCVFICSPEFLQSQNVLTDWVRERIFSCSCNVPSMVDPKLRFIVLFKLYHVISHRPLYISAYRAPESTDGWVHSCVSIRLTIRLC